MPTVNDQLNLLPTCYKDNNFLIPPKFFFFVFKKEAKFNIGMSNLIISTFVRFFKVKLISFC